MYRLRPRRVHKAERCGTKPIFDKRMSGEWVGCKRRRDLDDHLVHFSEDLSKGDSGIVCYQVAVRVDPDAVRMFVCQHPCRSRLRLDDPDVLDAPIEVMPALFDGFLEPVV